MSAWLADVPLEHDMMEEFIEGIQDPVVDEDKVNS